MPPLAVIGLALSRWRPDLSALSAVLLLTNLVAVILGAAFVFRLLDVRDTSSRAGIPLWARRINKVLVLATLILTAPLGYRFLCQVRTGESRPNDYSVSSAVRRAVKQQLLSSPNVSLVLVGRSAVDRDSGIRIVLEHPHRGHRFNSNTFAAIGQLLRLAGGDAREEWVEGMAMKRCRWLVDLGTEFLVGSEPNEERRE